jgi:hypothetical protein
MPSSTIAIGEGIDRNADASWGMTTPGTDLSIDASASNTRPLIGSTASSVSAIEVSRTFGSLCPSSIETHAKAWGLRLAHCDSSVIFPSPAGATTDTMGLGFALGQRLDQRRARYCARAWP